MTPAVTAVVLAAGKGERAGFEKNKLLIPLSGGKTAVEKSVAAFEIPEINEILLTVSEGDKEQMEKLFIKHPKVHILLGGKTRFDSVYNALQNTKSDIVLIHDGARPFVTKKTVLACLESVTAHGSGIAAVPVADTVAMARSGLISDIPPRQNIYCLQTPQGFYTRDLKLAYERAKRTPDRNFTDDSSVYRRFRSSPYLSEGNRENKKLTFPEDFFVVSQRIGFGIDTHAFCADKDYIVLAGVKIPSLGGLKAHSDGDVLVHAVMDALLSAAGLRDIGYYFPETDPAYENADSMELLKKVVDMLADKNYAVNNVSASVLAQTPRLSSYIDKMRANLSDALGVDVSAVGISAGTNEGLGYIGESKGITVYANALIYQF